MKTAVYIEDGTLQVALVPQTELERLLLHRFETSEARVFRGPFFYETRGGWVRASYSDHALLLRASPPQPPAPPTLTEDAVARGADYLASIAGERALDLGTREQHLRLASEMLSLALGIPPATGGPT